MVFYAGKKTKNSGLGLSSGPQISLCCLEEEVMQDAGVYVFGAEECAEDIGVFVRLGDVDGGAVPPFSYSNAPMSEMVP